MDRHCKNCDQLLYAGHNFCCNCGSKYVDFRLTPRSVLNEVSERYIGFDNRFLRTMVGLVRFPEDVINGYIYGLRKRYMNPINFYVLSLTFVGVQIFIFKNFGNDSSTSGLFVPNEAQTKMFEAILDYTGLLSTLNLPLYALVGYWVYKNLRIYNFTEHFIFHTYIWGFYNIVTTILVVPIIVLPAEWAMLSFLAFPLSVIHVFYAYHRVLKTSLDRTMVKAVVYILVFSVVLIILLLVAIVLGTIVVVKFFPELIESFKATA
ncbi:MAG: DUF3667 domain-containing protein [Nonlabens sp.]